MYAFGRCFYPKSGIISLGIEPMIHVEQAGKHTKKKSFSTLLLFKMLKIATILLIYEFVVYYY